MHDVSTHVLQDQHLLNVPLYKKLGLKPPIPPVYYPEGSGHRVVTFLKNMSQCVAVYCAQKPSAYNYL